MVSRKSESGVWVALDDAEPERAEAQEVANERAETDRGLAAARAHGVPAFAFAAASRSRAWAKPGSRRAAVA